MDLWDEVDLHDVVEHHLHEEDLLDDVEGDLQDFVVGFLETVWAHHVFVGGPHGRIGNFAVEGAMHLVADWEGPPASLVENLVVFVVGT